MSEEVLDELAVLSAIYCGEDEFEVVGESAETGLVYRINTVVETEEKKASLSLVFQLSPEYPHTAPDVSVSSSQLSRKQCQELRDGLLNKACSLKCRPMVHELVLWLQLNLSDLLTPSAPNSLKAQSAEDGSPEGLWTALLHLDHMRSKTKYIRLIEKWTSELGLTGRLFIGKAILILLQGERRSIKEYIHLQKTVKVDVDSSGKRCKEKMMSVLCEIPVSDDFKKISTFEVKDSLSSEELKKEFDEVGSLKLYQEFVSLLL